MIKRMKSWPTGELDLLIQAALSPEPRARQAWHSWTAARRFDDITWQEMRLLGSVYPRLPKLDPETPLRPRIEGILKNRWILAQLKLRESCEAFDCLRGGSIPFIVFKGGAFQAEGFSTSNRRVLGDIDILVRPRHALAALDALHQGGWVATNGESLEYLRRLATIRLNGNFGKGRYGNVDLHVRPFHYSRDDASLDEGLWARARSASLVSRPALVPDPTDSTLIVLAHATESTNGDWTVDVATRIREQEIEWDRLVETASRRGIVPAVLAGLGYLSDRIGVAVPDHATSKLSAMKVPLSQRLKYWSNVTDRSDRSLTEKAGNRLADMMLVRDGFSVVTKDRSAITVTRSTLSPRALAKQRRSSVVKASRPGLDHRVHLPWLDGGSRLVLELAFQQPVRSRRLFFDVCIDGVAVARLRTRAGGGNPDKRVWRRFQFPLPQSSAGTAVLEISARPSRFIRPGASADEFLEFGPFPFQPSAAWWLG